MSKKKGRPSIYKPEDLKDNGAPKLAVRFDPELYRYACSHPEGLRAYLEGLVREDKEFRDLVRIVS